MQGLASSVGRSHFLILSVAPDIQRNNKYSKESFIPTQFAGSKNIFFCTTSLGEIVESMPGH